MTVHKCETCNSKDTIKFWDLEIGTYYLCAKCAGIDYNTYRKHIMEGRTD